VELEAEETWLRKRIIRLRTVLRYANDARAEAGLREFIGDAENRLELLQATRPRPVQQQQQMQPNALGAWGNWPARSWRRALGLRLRLGQ
jgi:hypothetical protein